MHHKPILIDKNIDYTDNHKSAPIRDLSVRERFLSHGEYYSTHHYQAFRMW